MALALLLMLTAQGSDKPLLDQIGVKPTGRNGYEEFLQAGDVLARGMYDELFQADQNLTHRREIQPSRGSVLAKQLFAGKNPLERRRLLVERFAEATRLLEAAAAKPIFDPRTQYDASTLFPQLRWIRFSAHHLVNVAHVQRASGNDRSSVETLMRGLLILDSIQRGPMICWLIGNVCQLFLLEEMVAALPELSLGAATALEQQAAALEARTPSIVESLTAEYKFIEGSVNQLLGDRGDDFLDVFFDEKDKFAERFRALDALGKGEVAEMALRQIRDIRRQREAWIAEGPKGWLSPPDPLPQPGGTPASELANQLTEGMLAEVKSVMPAAAFQVVKYRLLRVSGAVIRYRWEQGRLPSTLVDVVGETLARCPISDKPLLYQRHPEGGFTVKSPGTDQTGEIRLVSRPPRPPSGRIDPVPSLSLR